MDRRINLPSYINKNALLLIILLGLLLRIITINQSLWHDEAITALAARDFSFKGIISDFIVVDNHTPLYYLLLRAWGLVFGFSDVVLRLFSVFLGVLTIYVFNKLVSFLEKDRKTVTLTTLLLSVSALHIYYSQEVRMYVLSTFLTVLSALFFLKVNNSKNNKFSKDHLYFGLSLVLLMSSDYVPVFFLPVFWVYAVFKRKEKGWWKNFLICHIPLFVFGILWSPVFFEQIQNYREVLNNLPFWKEVVGGASIKQLIIFWMKLVLGRISFEKIYYYPLIIISSVPYLILLSKSLKKGNAFYLLWFILPLFLGYITSFAFPAFNYFRFLYVVPAFYVLLIKELKYVKSWKYLLFSILAVNVLGLSIYYFDDNQKREDWKVAVAKIEPKAQKENSAMLFNYYIIPAGFRWYSEGYNNVYALMNERVLNSVLDDFESVYYFDYLDDIYDSEESVKKTLSSEFTESEIFDFKGVGQVRYYQKR